VLNSPVSAAVYICAPSRP